jgi:hypothetical protein
MPSVAEIGVLMAGSAVKGGSSALAREFLNNYVVPRLRGVVSKRAESKLKRNLNRYVRYLESKTRVLPSLANMGGGLPLDELYEPLTVVSDNEDFSLTIDSFPRSLFDHARCLALTDDAGMGKSTLAKFVARSAMSESKAVPLFIELRRLRAGTQLLDTLCQELAGAGLVSEQGRELVTVFDKGGFIFILDGFDEVEEAIRPALVAEINDLAAKFEFCYFVLTSRPEYSVSIFPEFVRLRILKLTEEQAHSLIRRIDGKRGLSKTLIQKVAEAGVGDFLGSPLLVTLLYRAFDHRNSVPPKRTMFFRQVYDALFEDHDLSKGDAFTRKKECGLDREDFHRLTRALGFETFKSGRVSYKEAELDAHIRQALARSDIDVDVKKFRNDLLKAVPIVVRDGLELRWCHKSFQDYFMSQYVLYDMDELRDKVITKMFGSSEALKYREVFRFFGESELSLLRAICIHPYMQELRAGVEEEDFPYACLAKTVEMFYIGDLDKDGDQIDFEECVRSRFGVSLSGRATSIVLNWANGWAIVSALKEGGARYILLSSMDPRSFPPYENLDRSKKASVWNRLYGSESRHIRGDIEELKGLEISLKSLSFIEAAAALKVIPLQSLRILEQSIERREDALSLTALDGF